MKGRQKRGSKIIAGVLTLSVLFILVLAGPAEALILDLSIPNDEAGHGQTITFGGSVEIENGEYPNITSLVLRLEGPMNVACSFDVDGNIISGCNGLIIQKLSSPTYNYGYGGYDPGILEYEFILNTTTYDIGIYNTFLDVLIDEVLSETQPGEDITIREIDFSILSPEAIDYATNFIEISVESTINAIGFTYSDNGKPFRTLCLDSDSCQLRIGSEEGDHTIIIRGHYDDGIVIEKTVSFNVDSLAPVYISSTPQRNEIVASTFRVVYTEENLKNITLLYGDDTTTREVTRTDCPAGTKQGCDFVDPDLSDFNLQKINYWFKISDDATTTTTEKIKFTPDLNAPVLNVQAPLTAENYDTNFVPFSVSTDKIVSEISYRDNNLGGSWTRLCRNCDGYGTSSSRRKYMASGSQNVSIRAKDYFGRITEQEIIFNVA